MNQPLIVAAPYSDKRLYEALANKWRSPLFIAEDDKAKYLDRHLRGLGVTSLVVEHDYTDGEYIDDYVSFYSRCFQDYDRRCTRIHCFAKPNAQYPDLKSREAIEWLLYEADEEAIKAYNAAYLGFIIARPLPETYIGRTVLKTWHNESRRRNFLAVAVHYVNIAGITLSVEGLPFEEQDHVVAACATVALWTCFHQWAKLFGGSAQRQSQITNLANTLQVASRPIPSQGLTIHQMCRAIRSAGLEPEVFPIINDAGTSTLPWLSLIVAYLELEVPIIMAVRFGEKRDLHALCVCGYGFESDRKRLFVAEQLRQSPIALQGLKIREIYAHDDQRGPYCHYFVENNDPSQVQATVEPRIVEYRRDSPDKPDAWKERKGTPIAFIMPVYPKISITFPYVNQLTRKLSVFLNRLFKLSGPGQGPSLSFEWSVKIQTVNRFKTTKRSECVRHPEYRKVLVQRLPRFLWVAELTSNDVKLLEFIIDATDTDRSLAIVSTIWHSESFRSRVKEAIAIDGPDGCLKVLGVEFGSYFMSGLG